LYDALERAFRRNFYMDAADATDRALRRKGALDAAQTGELQSLPFPSAEPPVPAEKTSTRSE
jgi:hypothetical protein